MKKNKLLMLAGIVACSLATPCLAEESSSETLQLEPALTIKPYVGLGVGSFVGDYKESSSRYSFQFRQPKFGGYVKGGLELHKYFAAEVRIGTMGTINQSWAVGTLGSTSAFTTSVKNDYFASFLAIGKHDLPVSFLEGTHSKIEGYGALGGTYAKFVGNTTLSTKTNSASKFGFTYGLGLNFITDDRLGFGVEWMEYLSNVKLGCTNAGTTCSMTMRGISGSTTYKF